MIWSIDFSSSAFTLLRRSYLEKLKISRASLLKLTIATRRLLRDYNIALKACSQYHIDNMVHCTVCTQSSSKEQMTLWSPSFRQELDPRCLVSRLCQWDRWGCFLPAEFGNGCRKMYRGQWRGLYRLAEKLLFGCPSSQQWLWRVRQIYCSKCPRLAFLRAK